MMTGKPLKGVGLLMGAIVLTAIAHPNDAAGQATESYELSGSSVAIYNIAGEARIVQGRGSAVVVHVMRGGADARELAVEVGEIGGRETLRVIYPSQQVVYSALGRGSNNSVRVRSDGTFYDGGRGGDRVEISGSGRGLEAYADLEIEVPAGRDFALYLAAGATDVRGVVGDVLIDTGSGSVVAANVAGSLTVDTGSGSVEVEGVRGSLRIDTGSGHVSVRSVEGDVSVDTGSGGVDIDDVRGGEINVDTGSGSVKGGDLSAPFLHVETGSGRIDLARVDSGDIVLETGSGRVDLQLLGDVTDLEIDTGSGSVTLIVTELLGAELEIETGSGGIDLDFPVQMRRVSRDHFEGSLGDGEGRIQIDTGSGRVRLMRR